MWKERQWYNGEQLVTAINYPFPGSGDSPDDQYKLGHPPKSKAARPFTKRTIILRGNPLRHLPQSTHRTRPLEGGFRDDGVVGRRVEP